MSLQADGSCFTARAHCNLCTLVYSCQESVTIIAKCSAPVNIVSVSSLGDTRCFI